VRARSGLPVRAAAPERTVDVVGEITVHRGDRWFPDREALIPVRLAPIRPVLQTFSRHAAMFEKLRAHRRVRSLNSAIA